MGFEEMKKIMKEKGFTTETLAEKSNVPKSTIDKILCGVTPDPRFNTVKQLANALDLTVDELLECLDVTVAEGPSFYNDDAADIYMNLIYENPGLRILLDASAKLTKEDIEAVVEIVKRMKATEQD